MNRSARSRSLAFRGTHTAAAATQADDSTRFLALDHVLVVATVDDAARTLPRRLRDDRVAAMHHVVAEGLTPPSSACSTVAARHGRDGQRPALPSP